MKKINKINKILIYIIIFVSLVMTIGFNLLFTKSPSSILYAQAVTNTTEIYNDGTILSSNLWKAIKKFYNDNKNEETSNRIYTNADTGFEYFYTDIFENFNTSHLDLSNKDIVSINNLGVLNLTSFTTIDLSNNKIKTTNQEFSKIENLEELNLSNNEISSFSYTCLNESSYGQNLQKLYLQQNKIVSCDLSKIAQGEIDATLNNITKDSLKLPENLSVKVNLSHNLIDEPVETDNIKYGFQGVKSNGTYVLGKKIYFYSFNEITEISIYSLKIENDILVENEMLTAILSGESYQFNLGYYRIKFVDNDAEELMLKQIDVYICPSTPTIKMFVNDEELENVTYSFLAPVTIKFYGEENAKFVYILNNMAPVEANEVEIKTPGVNILTIYQIVDGYQSAGYQLFLTYKQPANARWLFVVGGTLIFAILFYLAIKYMPKLAKLRLGEKKHSNRDNLD